jgi:hypothetical protein
MGAVAVVAASVMFTGCTSEDSINETVATVNGNRITVMEVREAIGIPGGLVAVPMLEKEQKRKIIEQIAETRILAQEARARGIDNSAEFKDAIKAGEAGIIVKGLFRKELDVKAKKAESEIDAAAKTLMAKDNNLKPIEARLQAGQAVFGSKISQVQAEVTAAARKAFPEKIDAAMVAAIAKGEPITDNAVVGQAGNEKMTYGEAKELIGKAMQGGKHSGKDFTRDEKALTSVILQDLQNKSMVAYARQQGSEKGRWFELDRSLLENSVLIGMLAEKVIFKDISVSDKEIEATYNEHKEMFNKGGKVLALAEVRGQIVSFLQDDKRRKAVEAFLAPLKAKAKVVITDSMLPKI